MRIVGLTGAILILSRFHLSKAFALGKVSYNRLHTKFLHTQCHKTTASLPVMSSSADYFDVHAHLLHEQFVGEEIPIGEKAFSMGVGKIILNGLNPENNRNILSFCETFPISNVMLPALGIYPIDACCNLINDSNWDNNEMGFAPPEKFDVDKEIDFIESCVQAKKIVAIGECGLDRYYIDTVETNQEQERVLRRLMRIARDNDIPIILHTRKAEQRVFEMLVEEKVKKADFHCYGGKIKLAQKIAESGYYFSIPSAVERNQDFQRLANILPIENILTETDCPYMGPDRGCRNDPSTVVRGVAGIAKAKQMSLEDTKNQLRSNFRVLFGI